MQADTLQPTPDPDINAILRELLSNVQTILGHHFVGMYLEGSLANGDFDAASDVDFIVVSDEDISGDRFTALQTMHERIAASNSPWATELEGSYIGRRALRRYDPAHALHPNIERGRNERLKLADHDAAWVIHRYILRERGITLAGPPPHTLVDPVSPTDLRQAMRSMLPRWVTPILQDPARIHARGYQSFIVLSLCRVLYTLQHGAVVSKRVAAHWAQESLDESWVSPIERAWEGRRNPDEAASSADIQRTLDFIRYTLERSRQWADDAEGKPAGVT
jgi:predicted nucleotidyltransferase